MNALHPFGQPESRLRRAQPWFSIIGLGGVLAFIVARAAGAWQHFPSLIGDNGWYLQVAWRVSQGETLYRDVAWAYGPLPAQALAAAFRRLGPDAAFASAINTALAVASLGLTYCALRYVLAPGPALALTAFAAAAGGYVGGDLIRQHLYAYTQAIPWGAAGGLATLVALLRWTNTRRLGWLLAAGAAAALATLSKPEYAVTALGASLIVLPAARARPAAWLAWLAAWGAVAGGGLAWQASAASWHALWRGYTGYDQLAVGGLWGMPGAQVSPRWLLSVAAAWAAPTALLVGHRHPRWRRACRAAAALALLGVVALILPDLVGLSGRQALAALAAGAWAELRFYPQVALQWAAAVPWSLLTPLLLWAAWRGRRVGLPVAWWGLWAFALLNNLRFTFTGYASPLAVAPGLAVLWRLWPAIMPVGIRQRRGAWLALAALAMINLAAQPFSVGLPDRGPVSQVPTVLGPVVVMSDTARQVRAVQDVIAEAIPPAAPIIALQWGGGWYLATGHPNPTRFDLLVSGVGGTGSDGAEVRAALAARPPTAVIMPSWLWRPDAAPIGNQHKARVLRAGLITWWDTLAVEYADVTPPEVIDWVVLVRRGT